MPYLLLAGLALAPIAMAQDSACPAPEAHAFDFWIGSWDVANAQRNPSQPEDSALHATGEAVMRVHPVAKGCAVVEHWQGSLVRGEVHGFSVRSFDPESARWTAVLLWPSPQQPVASFGLVEGAFEHGRGTFTAQKTAPDGTPVPTRFTFSDIAPERYRWDAARSDDGGASWATSWIMRGTRRPAEAEPIDPDSPALSVPTEPLCTEPEHRALDGLVGRWTGETDGPFAPLPVTLEVRSILGGCALTEQWTIGEAEHFAVRAWDAGTDQWVAWRLHSDDPKLPGVPLRRWRGARSRDLRAQGQALGVDRGGRPRRRGVFARPSRCAETRRIERPARRRGQVDSDRHPLRPPPEPP
ncbi:MAG: hypothetical protein JRJ84_15230 [Deltaproteobacteria bacterium]|nr:hypothetical protein [Deltaproteobacteria bacterium]